MKTFKAKCITCQNEQGEVTVGFADDEFNTTEYVLLQRDIEPDDQDRELGLDQIYVEVDSQERSGYGGVELIRLDGLTLHIELTEKMAHALGTSIIQVQLAATDEQLAALKEHLSLLVGDEPILQV